MNSLEQRIIHLAFIPLKELPDELRRLGVKVEIYEQGKSFVIDNGSMRVGLMECDPITKAVQLGFGLCGSMWASALPNLLPEVQKKWSRQKSKQMNNFKHHSKLSKKEKELLGQTVIVIKAIDHGYIKIAEDVRGVIGNFSSETNNPYIQWTKEFGNFAPWDCVKIVD